MKIKILDNAPLDTRESAEKLAAAIKEAKVVQVVGRTAVLYRKDPETPVIRFP